MPSLLLSGPAGGGKSQEAKRRRDAATAPTVVADFQSVVAALLQQERGPDGKYPLRPDWVLPLAEYVRRAIITGAKAREIDVIATNSDGDPGRRRFLLEVLGPGDREEILVDPGEEVVARRLAGKSGRLSGVCSRAIGRWYNRLPGGRRR